MVTGLRAVYSLLYFYWEYDSRTNTDYIYQKGTGRLIDVKKW